MCAKKIKRRRKKRLGFGIRKPYPNPNKLDKTKDDLKDKKYMYIIIMFISKTIDKSYFG